MKFPVSLYQTIWTGLWYFEIKGGESHVHAIAEDMNEASDTDTEYSSFLDKNNNYLEDSDILSNKIFRLLTHVPK